MVFYIRLEGADFESIDRFVFLIALRNALDSSSTLQLLFGHGIGSLLPYKTCLELLPWSWKMHADGLFCSSSTLHSFFMRLIYDVGIIGSSIFLYCWFLVLGGCNNSRLRIVFFLIFSSSSLSISGFSNSIIIFPALISFLIKKGSSAK